MLGSHALVEPGIEVDLRTLSEVRPEAAFAAEAPEFPCAGSRYYEPVATDDVAGNGALVLEQKASAARADRSIHPFNTDEARRSIWKRDRSCSARLTNNTAPCLSKSSFLSDLRIRFSPGVQSPLSRAHVVRKLARTADKREQLM
jgi:hypothetical protein